MLHTRVQIGVLKKREVLLHVCVCVDNRATEGKHSQLKLYTTTRGGQRYVQGKRWWSQKSLVKVAVWRSRAPVADFCMKLSVNSGLYWAGLA